MPLLPQTITHIHARVVAIARTEVLIAARNRWIAIASVMMALFSLVLSLAGSAPTGALGVDALAISVASLTSLAVYIVPLLALLLGFDAIAGEVERGTLALTLTYPGGRGEMLVGKMLAHVGVLGLAIGLGYSAALAVSLWQSGGQMGDIGALWRLYWTSLILGAAFLGLGYAISAMSRRPGAAAGLAIGVWLVFVVLYDLGLLALIVSDDGGFLTVHALPVLLLINPSDAFRLYNLSLSDAMSLGAGAVAAGGALSPVWALAALLTWPVAAMAGAWALVRRITP